MNCSDFEKAVQQRLDGVREPERRELDAHLAACPECRGLDEAASRLEEGLAIMRSSAAMPPIGMRERIVRRALGEQRARSRRRRLVTMALAASVALVVVVSRNWLLPPRPGANVVTHRETPSLKRSVRDAQLALSSIVNRTTGTAIDEGRSLLPVSTSFEAPTLLTRSLDPPVRTLRVTSARVGESLNPVLTSAKDAVVFFLGDDRKIEGGKEK